MTQYMLLFSLGPVQSFIAQARKTRDLWLGSFLLSVLMQKSMKGIESNLVFPYKPFIEHNISDLPNKYIAIFNTLDEATTAATQSETNINTLWKDICEDVWKKVLEKPAQFTPITRTIWDRQVDPANVFEMFWVVVKGTVEGTPEDYKKWLHDTHAAFDGRKRLRNFGQQEESGEKSTLSGERAALRGPGDLRSDVQTFWYDVAKKQSARDISKDGTERLDAIDTVKRFAFDSKHLAQELGVKHVDAGFPSTSSMATATFMERLIAASENPTLSSLITTWLTETGKLGETMPATIPLLAQLAQRYPQGQEILARDGDCYFPETFSARRLQKEFGFGNDRKKDRDELAEDGPQAISALLRATDALTPPIARPTSYYTMIQMDGDRMGTLLDGVANKEEHRDISKALSEFSREDAPTFVERSYPGRLIYAGGDDVFALAPLARDYVQMGPMKEGESHPIKTVLELVDQLQQQYQAKVRNAVKDEASNAEPVASVEGTTPSRKEQVTASAGIAIAHHYTSLSYVRRMSKEAEHLAKEHYGRNALVVTVLRRSGEQTRVGCHWHYAGLPDEAQPVALFSSFYDLFNEDVLSPKCVHTLLEEAPTLVGLHRGAQCSEIKRVLRRQRAASMDKRLPDDEIAKKADYLVKLAEAMDKDNDKQLPLEEKKLPSVELHADERRYGLVEVLGWLLVMLFLTRKEQE